MRRNENIEHTLPRLTKIPERDCCCLSPEASRHDRPKSRTAHEIYPLPKSIKNGTVRPNVTRAIMDSEPLDPIPCLTSPTTRWRVAGPSTKERQGITRGGWRRRLPYDMMRVRNVLTPWTGNGTLRPPLVTCDGEGADRESTMSARLLNRLLSGGVRPQGYADPEAHLTPCELASNKVLEQKLSARFTAERSGN